MEQERNTGDKMKGGMQLYDEQGTENKYWRKQGNYYPPPNLTGNISNHLE